MLRCNIGCVDCCCICNHSFFCCNMFLLLLYWHSQMFCLHIFVLLLSLPINIFLIESFHCYTFVIIYAPQIIHLFVKGMCVCNTCNTDFCLFIVQIINSLYILHPIFRPCLNVNTFCSILVTV